MEASMGSPLAYLHDELEALKAQHLYFRLRVLEGEQRPVARFDGREVINLSSNNYLGLTTHPRLRRAAIEATRRFGVGTGAVRTIAGTMTLHMELEEQIARFKHTEAAVVFQSGFTANAGTVAAILGKDDLIVSDELNHASIIDGCRLSKATIRVYRHCDVADCERILQETANWPGRKLLITDGVFSMDGDIAPLPQLCELARRYNCIMMVDDAHASGVLGRNGRGTVDHFNCHGRVDIQVGTLSKAIGVMGGYVCGSRDLIEFLYHRARPFLFSTSHPPAIIGACQAAFALLDSPEGERLIERLWRNTEFFKKGLKKSASTPAPARRPSPPSWSGTPPALLNFHGLCSRRASSHRLSAIPPFPRARRGCAPSSAQRTRRKDLARALEVIERVAHRLGILEHAAAVSD